MEGGGGGGSCDDHQLLLLLMSEDLLIQILMWLPVISLSRFKSVCKSWRSIIESPFFIHLHHATSTLPTSSSSKLGSSNILLFRRSHLGIYDQMSDISICRPEMANISIISGDEFDVFENFGMPPLRELDDEGESFHHPGEYDEMVGCCNGIICLHDSFNMRITLWNPATKQYRFLPIPSNQLLGYPNNYMHGGYYAQSFVRFGIDVKTKDQKLLQITTLKPCYGGAYMSNEGRSVHVYSSSTDSWRRIDDATLSAAHPNIEMNMKDRGYLNGRCFFTAQYCLNEEEEEEEDQYFMSLILSFDFTEEIFRTIQPPYDRGSADFQSKLFFIPFGEKIALADPKTTAKQEEDGYYSYEYEYDIWVLNEQQHGVEEYSWTKFYTFGPYSKPNPPQCITNNGEFAIINGHWLDFSRVMNLMTGETKDLQCGSKCITDVGAYKPSLITIGGSGATDN